MKLYKNLEIEVSCQNLGGKNFLIVFKGNENDIILAANSWYNLMGSDFREITWEDGNHFLATISSTEKKIKLYFKNLFMNRFRDKQEKGMIVNFKAVRQYLKKAISKNFEELMSTHSIVKNYYLLQLSQQNTEFSID